MLGKRAQRVATLIKHELGEVLTKKVRDPRVGFITITDVKISDDLQYARVFYSVMGSDTEKEKTAKGLGKARGFLQRDLAAKLKLRFTPHLSFLQDPSIDEGMKIDSIIERIHDEGAD